MEITLNFSLIDEIIKSKNRKNGRVSIDELKSIFTPNDILANYDEIVDYVSRLGYVLGGLESSVLDAHADSLNLYLSSLNKYKILNKEEEFKLFEEYGKGNDTARTKIINHNLRLVVSIAKQYKNTSLSLIDLIQEGNIGLIEAISRYDSGSGNRFATYATFWIKKSIISAIEGKGTIVKVPNTVTRNIKKISKAINKLKENNGKEPESIEIYNELKGGIDLETIATLTNLDNEIVSLDLEIGDNDLHGIIGDESSSSPSSFAENEDQLELLNRQLARLTPREVFVLSKRFGLDDGKQITLEEIGKELKLTREAVRYIENQAISKIQIALKLR